ncbi:hypothetical protein BN2475_720014 [Paraburkholderia ribeironis]|uniref:Uncharacterized protein n=1 Tax=Paraburkholderia ribeironis TaxID=1247936 RepID=A0A1N7SIW2_9BURK|nr:hypothetical protein BN2475_720014 [Paraburkholderia ribeironis]
MKGKAKFITSKVPWLLSEGHRPGSILELLLNRHGRGEGRGFARAIWMCKRALSATLTGYDEFMYVLRFLARARLRGRSDRSPSLSLL